MPWVSRHLRPRGLTADRRTRHTRSQGDAMSCCCRSVVILFTFLTLLAFPASAAERRVALVVGAAAYRAVPVLRNTLNDARGVAAALGRLGFEVDTVADPDRGAFEAAVRRFGARAQGADVALFFYAGHAVESAGRNWLMPISANIRCGRDLRFEAIDLDSVLEQLEGAARLAVVMLDSCRDNPFRLRLGEGGRGLPGGGLAQVQAAAGTLVVFSTAPGTVAADGAGPNSPFTTALLKRIETPGVEFRQVLAEVRRDVRESTKGKQVPWEQSAMEGTLFMKPAAEPPATAKADPTAPRPGLEAEVLFWDSVRNSTNAAELKAYLARYPDGIFAELARTRLGLQSAPAPVAILGPIPAPAPPPERPLADRLLAEMPAVEVRLRESIVRAYVAMHGSKALAVSLERKDTYSTRDWSNAALAEEGALEGCQINYGSPCVLFAVNAEVRAPGPRGEWARRDMPRVRYAGPFDPAQIPRLREEARTGPVVTGYQAIQGSKAIAFHHSGRIFAASAATERDAQARALSTCNADPDRKGADGPCFLYAIGNQVVLPRRLTLPEGQPSASMPGTLAAQLFEAAPAAAGWNDIAERYAKAQYSKAIAVSPEHKQIWWEAGWNNAAQAQRLALERCQVFYGAPCQAFATEDAFVEGERTRNDMPRVRYAGPFDPAQVPTVSEVTRSTPAIQRYGSTPAPKAMVLNARGLVYVSDGAASLVVAQTQALGQCNVARRPDDKPCLLYAFNDDVVLPQRRTQPVPTRTRSAAEDAPEP